MSIENALTMLAVYFFTRSYARIGATLLESFLGRADFVTERVFNIVLLAILWPLWCVVPLMIWIVDRRNGYV